VLNRVATAGFSVVELMVVMVVIGLLMAFAVPSFSEFLSNQQIRVGADAVMSGIQVARAEAIRRNLSVQVAIDVPNSGWVVTESASGTVVQTRTHEEGSRNVNLTTMPGGTTTLTFTPLGGVTGNADGTFSVQQIDIDNPGGGACQSVSGPMRCLRILVTGGGSVRMCDPNVPVMVPPDPRACP